VGPPAGKGTTKVMGLFGHSWAITARGAAQIKKSAFFKVFNKNAEFLLVLVNIVVSFIFTNYCAGFIFTAKS
jgi:hypothetical protein